jgi:hypothetical protein
VYAPQIRNICHSNLAPRYRNAVTGLKRSERPIEPQGGILADEMGLGKTLTVLSHIVGTLDTANGFANMTHQEGITCVTKSPLTPVRGTLVVAPLSCKLNKLLKLYIAHSSSAQLLDRANQNVCAPFAIIFKRL